MTVTHSNRDFHGLIVFKIKGDGCLNASWINTDNKNSIMNESARKIGKDRSSLAGEYSMTYIEATNDIVTGKLIITISENIYQLKWFRDDNSLLFEGIGLMSGKKHLIASYWKSENK